MFEHRTSDIFQSVTFDLLSILSKAVSFKLSKIYLQIFIYFDFSITHPFDSLKNQKWLLTRLTEKLPTIKLKVNIK